MPFISTRTNQEITKEKEASIAEKLGRAITILGKSESWLMLDFQDHCRMYFKGDHTGAYAYVEIKLFGRGTNDAYDKMTAEVTRIIAGELGIAGDGIYVQYEEVEHWGYNGINF